MTEPTQAPTHRCECGRTVPVVAVTTYEFDYRCPCGRAGRIAWAHAAEPPLWVVVESQPPLF